MFDLTGVQVALHGCIPKEVFTMLDSDVYALATVFMGENLN